MAPADAANSLKGNRPRPSAVRTIVPAIPLPYIQKRKQYATAAARVEEAPAPLASAETPKTTSTPVTDDSENANGLTDVTGNAEVDADLSPDNLNLCVVKDSVETPADEVQEGTAE